MVKTKKEKSLGDKLCQLSAIDDSGKLGLFQSLSNAQDVSKKDLYQGIANNNQSELLENLLKNIFASGFPKKVDLKLFTIEKISQEEGIKMIDIIDKYLQGEYGGTNRGAPLHVYFEPELIQFYYSLCERCIFDVDELQKKRDFCINYFKKTILLSGRARECIVNFEKLGLDKQGIFDLIKDNVNLLTSFYIDELNKKTENKKANIDFESLKKYLSDITGSRIDGRLNVKKEIENKVSFDTIICVLNELDMEKTKNILQQIRNISLEVQDYSMYTYVDRVMTLGKELNYNTSGSSVSLGTKNGKEIYARLCDTGGKKIVFFDKDHYKRLEDGVLSFGYTPSNFYQIIGNVFPENIGIQKHDLSSILLKEQEEEKARKNFEQKIGIPVKSLDGNLYGFKINDYKGRKISYGIREGFDYIDAKKSVNGETISLDFNELDATTNGKQKIKDVSQAQAKKMKSEIDEYVEQLNFFYEHIQSLGDKIYDISRIYKFLKKDIYGNYCLDWQAKKGKNIYIVFDKNKNLFEIKDYKDVEIIKKEKTGNNVQIIIPK